MLVNVITNKAVPPAVMVLGIKDLMTSGRLGFTGSESAAVHVPEPQLRPVLVTPAGTDIDAVLVTRFWAAADCWNVSKKQKSAKPQAKTPTDILPRREDKRKLRAFFEQFNKNYSLKS